MAARIVGILRLFRPGAVFIFNEAGRVRIDIFNEAGRVRIEMRLS